MQKDTQSNRRSFKPYSVATLAILAIAGAVAVFTGVAPASAASLTGNVPAGVFAFIVPLTLLVMAIVFEVTRLAVRNQLPAEKTLPVRGLSWNTRRTGR